MSRSSAEAAARASREEMGLGLQSPLPDVLFSVIEEHHERPIAVTLMALADDIAGAFMRREDRPYIFVNSWHYPVRRRFTLAHELGHIRLGHRPVIDTEELIHSNATQEVEANAFAAEFLVPKIGVQTWVDTKHSPDTPIELLDVVRLAHYFRISAKSARIRLEAAGVLPSAGLRRKLDAAIDAQEHTQLARQLGLSDEAGVGGRDDIGRVELGGHRATETAIGDALKAVEQRALDVERAAELLDMDGHALSLRMGEDGFDLVPEEPEPAPLDD